MRTSLFLLACFLFISCSENNKELKVEDLSVNNFPQKWTLYKTTGMTPNSETMGEQMEWQEYYIFNADSTFIKNRTRDGENLTAEGTFKTGENEGRKFYLLEYKDETDLIGNCTGNLEEYLSLSEDTESLMSSWWQCDGPGLFYRLTSIK